MEFDKRLAKAFAVGAAALTFGTPLLGVIGCQRTRSGSTSPSTGSETHTTVGSLLEAEGLRLETKAERSDGFGPGGQDSVVDLALTGGGTDAVRTREYQNLILHQIRDKEGRSELLHRGCAMGLYNEAYREHLAEMDFGPELGFQAIRIEYAIRHPEKVSALRGFISQRLEAAQPVMSEDQYLQVRKLLDTNLRAFLDRGLVDVQHAGHGALLSPLAKGVYALSDYATKVQPSLHANTEAEASAIKRTQEFFASDEVDLSKKFEAAWRLVHEAKSPAERQIELQIVASGNLVFEEGSVFGTNQPDSRR